MITTTTAPNVMLFFCETTEAWLESKLDLNVPLQDIMLGVFLFCDIWNKKYKINNYEIY